MLHIILLILKIIGIVLLCVVGMLLLAIACMMFVPVRYRFRLTREEDEDKPPVAVYAKVTWLLHLVNVLVRYPAKVMVRARVLIFTVFRMPKKEKKAGKVKKSEKDKKTRQSDKKGNKEKYGEAGTAVDADASTGTQEHTASKEREVPVSSDKPGEKESLFAKIREKLAKIRQIVEKIKEFFENIQYTIRKFYDKIKAVPDNIQYYREVLESEPFRQSVELCKGELGWVFKKLKPDKFEADFIVGMEDPAATGEILALCGMLYPLIGQHVRVVGDFDCEKTHIEGQLYIRGRIRVITFIRAAVRIYFNKDIKKLMKLLKKEAV